MTHGAWQRESKLGEEGIDIALRVGTTFLRGMEFDYYGCSPFVRCRETARTAIPQGEGKWDQNPHLAPILVEEVDAVSKAIFPREFKALDEMEAAVLELFGKSLFEIETAWVHEALIWALQKTGPGRSSVIVGHQPHGGFLSHLLMPDKFEKFAFDLPKAGIRRFRFSPDNHIIGIDHYDPPPLLAGLK